MNYKLFIDNLPNQFKVINFEGTDSHKDIDYYIKNNKKKEVWILICEMKGVPWI